MREFNVITLFPNLFTSHLENLPFKKAIESGELKVNLINLRDFSLDNYKTVDDKPYGGGVGMLLMIEPIYKALKSIYKDIPLREEKENKESKGKVKVNKEKKRDRRIILLSPRGEKLTQEKVKELKESDQITFICGRYEGVDERVNEYATDVISIGDYVLSGGELPTLVIMEAITRLLPNVLEKEEAVSIESFTDGYLEYPQYTRPYEFDGLKVPDVLLSGNHAEIEKWRKENSVEITE